MSPEIAKFGRRSTGFLWRIAGGIDSNFNHSQCNYYARVLIGSFSSKTTSTDLMKQVYTDQIVLNLGVSESVYSNDC